MIIYAAGGLLALASTGLTLLIIGYSLLEGVRLGADDSADLHFDHGRVP